MVLDLTDRKIIAKTMYLPEIRRNTKFLQLANKTFKPINIRWIWRQCLVVGRGGGFKSVFFVDLTGFDCASQVMEGQIDRIGCLSLFMELISPDDEQQQSQELV